MHSRIFGLMLACMIGLVQGSAFAAEDENLIKLPQEQPAFLVQADVDRPDRFYRDGDSMRVLVTSEVDAYVYVLYKQADGKILQIFPNSAQPTSHVLAKKTFSIPATESLFRWKVGAPFGKEAIKVIASKDPIEALSAKELQKQQFNPVNTDVQKQAIKDIAQTETKKWSESIVEITTAPRDAATPRQTGKRFGVFFGASEYEFHDIMKEMGGEGARGPNLPCPANNAMVTGRLMKSIGALDEYKVFTNSESTKANLQEAVTKWLPSVSRPGDTVFIMYCGHGGQMSDDNGDESDGKDEYLMTHDYIDIGILSKLVTMDREGKLDPKMKPRVDRLRQIAINAKEDVKANEAVIRETCVSDDQFGHWLQRLSGRKILVMLDTCHAGGLIANEKSLKKGDTQPNFDYLDSEIGRLKDIGQPDAALLAACGAQQVSYGLRVRDSLLEEWKAELNAQSGKKGEGEEDAIEELAVYSYHLVDGLVSLPGPLDVVKLHAHMDKGMKEYFETVNELKRKAKAEAETLLIPHAPTYSSFCKEPILMKP
ncbi:MAG: DUF4384 domain-containing protein [Planctomycetota bacterium]|nr:DUF4384 domain-containing protein [Planctomycetota bacterium]